jgi:fluoride exporter
MTKIVAIAIGGGIGALMRFGVTYVSHWLIITRYPIGTLIANLTGCFIMGILWNICNVITVKPEWKLMLLTGMLGAFTTFSTYSLETFGLFREQHFKMALLNIVLSNILGIFLIYLGHLSSHHIISWIK